MSWGSIAIRKSMVPVQKSIGTTLEQCYRIFSEAFSIMCSDFFWIYLAKELFLLLAAVIQCRIYLTTSSYKALKTDSQFFGISFASKSLKSVRSCPGMKFTFLSSQLTFFKSSVRTVLKFFFLRIAEASFKVFFKLSNYLFLIKVFFQGWMQSYYRFLIQTGKLAQRGFVAGGFYLSSCISYSQILDLSKGARCQLLGLGTQDLSFGRLSMLSQLRLRYGTISSLSSLTRTSAKNLTTSSDCLQQIFLFQFQVKFSHRSTLCQEMSKSYYTYRLDLLSSFSPDRLLQESNSYLLYQSYFDQFLRSFQETLDC